MRSELEAGCVSKHGPIGDAGKEPRRGEATHPLRVFHVAFQVFEILMEEEEENGELLATDGGRASDGRWLHGSPPFPPQAHGGRATPGWTDRRTAALRDLEGGPMIVWGWLRS